ncbi:MAG: hypothetical protein ABIP29_00185 [Candidatus Eisenbacteria bacterium]
MPAGRTRRRTRSALVPAGFVLLALLLGIAPAGAQDATPSSTRPSYTRAYVALGAGAALTGASFLLAERADRDYERYLAETDPLRLEDAYQKAKRGDRLSAAALIAGQAGFALAVYWRFLHHPRQAREQTAPTWGVAPRVGPDGSAGVALDVRF